jgi:acyl carrier protein
MSVDPPVVNAENLGGIIRHIISEVLMIPEEYIQPDSALVNDLGAESIDFLDLIFHMEEALGKKIPPERWQEYVEENLTDTDLTESITTEVVIEFAKVEAGVE